MKSTAKIWKRHAANTGDASLSNQASILLTVFAANKCPILKHHPANRQQPSRCSCRHQHVKLRRVHPRSKNRLHRQFYLRRPPSRCACTHSFPHIPSLHCLTSCAGATRRRQKATRLKTERAHERASAIVDESGIGAAGGAYFRIQFIHTSSRCACFPTMACVPCNASAASHVFL
jgi:hypothetical protein